MFSTSTGKRPLLRRAASGRALEIDLSKDDADAEKLSVISAKGELVADLTQHGQQFVLCKGGRGGLGNRNFATAARQTPRFAQPGEPGDEGDFLLELRIVAEVGLVGYPNAGKSTLLTAISRARPKVAPYPFTTLHPQIGIVEYADWKRLTVCDVPGLIEGAHKNVGLGHKFLRHIQRCKILVLLLDMAGTDNRKPWDDYKQLLSELELYDPALLEKPRLVVANKMDEAVAEKNLKEFKKKIKKVSCCRFPPRLIRAWRNFGRRFAKRLRKQNRGASAGTVRQNDMSGACGFQQPFNGFHDDETS
jgi:GTP-binding protein